MKKSKKSIKNFTNQFGELDDIELRKYANATPYTWLYYYMRLPVSPRHGESAWDAADRYLNGLSDTDTVDIIALRSDGDIYYTVPVGLFDSWNFLHAHADDDEVILDVECTLDEDYLPEIKKAAQAELDSREQERREEQERYADMAEEAERARQDELERIISYYFD